MTLDIDRLRELLDKATPGPWDAGPHPDEHTATSFWYIYGPGSTIIAEVDGEEDDDQPPILANTVGSGRTPEIVEANAALIAESRNTLPDLLDALAAERTARLDAEAEIARLREAVVAWRQWGSRG